MQLLDLLFFALCSILHLQISFSLIFRASYNIWIKDFCHNFSFLTDSLKPPSHKQPKSAKRDKNFLLMLAPLKVGIKGAFVS